MTNQVKNQESLAEMLKRLKIRKNSQKAKILELLLNGHVLDDMKALNLIGCWSLSQRIGELKKADIDIGDDWVYSIENGKRYKRYFLPQFAQKKEGKK